MQSRIRKLRCTRHAAILCGTTLFASCATPGWAIDPPTATAFAAPSPRLSKVLQGRASLTHDAWERYFTAGSKSLDQRLYEQAQQRLSAALSELQRHNITDIRLAQTKEALGRTYLGLEKFEDAERILTDAVLRATKIGPAADNTRARAASALAETLVARAKFDRAESIAKEAIAAGDHPGVNEPRAVGRAYLALGESLAARGLVLDAAEAYKKATATFEQRHVGDEQDLADAHYRYALLLHAQGSNKEAEPHFERAFSIYDAAAIHNRALAYAPHLVLRWEEGSPRARIVPDQDYPLKYTHVGGVRIAATLVRSENVIAALISLSNCSRNKKEVAVGKVTLQQLQPKNKLFRHVHPTELDTALEAEHVTELTWRRAWLNHIQKTRRIPGYLKDGVLDVDNFFGNNTFGLYGAWQAVARRDTPIVTREQFLYSPYNENPNNDSAEFLTHTPVGTRPMILDVGESKTGLVYFGQERFEKAILKIVVGNTIVEIPFDHAGPR